MNTFYARLALGILTATTAFLAVTATVNPAHSPDDYFVVGDGVVSPAENSPAAPAGGSPLPGSPLPQGPEADPASPTSSRPDPLTTLLTQTSQVGSPGTQTPTSPDSTGSPSGTAGVQARPDLSSSRIHPPVLTVPPSDTTPRRRPPAPTLPTSPSTTSSTTSSSSITTSTSAPATTTSTKATTTTTAKATTTTTKPKTTTTTKATTPTTTKPATPTTSGPLVISNKSSQVIENVHISNPSGACVTIQGSSNITLRNVTLGPCGSWAVFVDSSQNITISDSYIETGSSKGGVYGHLSQGVAVLRTEITRSGRNPIQFDKVTGANNRIEFNNIYTSAAEDMISVYKSGGTSQSWLRVVGNTLRNNIGQSHSGSGIMVGDAGGSYTLVENNNLTDPGQVGIGVAGGNNIRVISNTVSSKQFAWSNVGIYVWDQYNSNCHSIEVRANKVNWINSAGKKNNSWDGKNCGTVAGWSDNDW